MAQQLQVIPIQMQLPAVSFNAYVEQVQKGCNVMKVVVVCDVDSMTQAISFLAKGKAVVNMVNDAIETITRPAKDAKKDIDKWQSDTKAKAAEVIAPLLEQMARLEKDVLAYQRKIREEDELRRKKTERLTFLEMAGFTLQGNEFVSHYMTVAADAINTDAEWDKAERKINAAVDAINKKAAEEALKASQMQASPVAPKEEQQRRLDMVIALGAVHNGRGYMLMGLPVDYDFIQNPDDEMFNAYYDKLLMHVAEKQPTQVEVSVPKAKGTTTTWHYEIVDPTRVPREYCEPAPGLLNAAVRAGKREIPGVKIFSKESIR